MALVHFPWRFYISFILRNCPLVPGVILPILGFPLAFREDRSFRVTEREPQYSGFQETALELKVMCHSGECERECTISPKKRILGSTRPPAI